jgi:hypothetical protein
MLSPPSLADAAKRQSLWDGGESLCNFPYAPSLYLSDLKNSAARNKDAKAAAEGAINDHTFQS